MANVIEILKSSGPINLDELNLRTSGSPTDLTTNLANLQKTGQITIQGPRANEFPSLSEEQVQNASDLVVELTPAAMRRLAR